MEENLGLFLKTIVERNSTRNALLYGPGDKSESWTYSRLWEETDRVAAWLQDEGIEKGDRVIIWAPNNPWWVAAYFGALRLGAIVVPLDMRSSPGFVERVLEQTEPRMAFVCNETRANWNYPAPSMALEEMNEQLPRERVPREIEVGHNDVAELMFTSGTTGTPKGVILTHGNILSQLYAADQMVRDVREYRVVSILPLSHMFEQVGGLLLALKRNASIYYLEVLQPASIFSALVEHKATALVLVPQVLQLFMSGIEREAAKLGKDKMLHRMMKMADHLPSNARRMMFRQVLQRMGGEIEFLVSAGAPVSPDLVFKWEAIGIPIIQGYGLTEASAAVTVSQMHNRNPRTVGTAIPNMEIKISPEGEVLVKGPSVTPGYWQNPQATEDAFEDGWYKTGDLGYFDDKGLLYIRGRKKDMIALANGQNVYAQDVEAALMEVPGVKDAAVVGMPEEVGQKVHAVLILEEDAPDPQAILKQANKHLAPHQQIRGFSRWPDEDFPRTHTLKIKKHEILAALLRGKEAHAEAPMPEAVPVG